MGHLTKQKQGGLSDLAVVATAMGAAAVDAFAGGALTIRWLAIGRIAGGSAAVVSLEVHDLAVTRLSVGEVVVASALEPLPADVLDKATS